MKIINIIKMAFKNIVSNKLRSALTMLGLIIGIASVIILVGIGQGATTSVTDSVQSLGTDILTLNITSSDTYIEYEKVKDLLSIENVSSVAPYKSVSGTASRGTTSSSRANIIATNDSYLDITNVDLAKVNKVPQKECTYCNLQQLPADEPTRSAFVAPEGYKLVNTKYIIYENLKKSICSNLMIMKL